MAKHIVVFDSGIGGTSVLEHIQNKIPHAKLSYLMDNKYLPYGELSFEFLTQRITSLLSHFITLIEPVDLLVIACNTASTQTLDILRQHFNFPIVGVVPAIKPAAEKTLSKKIGVLATPATVANEYTASLVKNFAASCSVSLYGSSQLVKLAEQKFWKNDLDSKQLEQELNTLYIDKEIDQLVLGCTHFPIIAEEIKLHINPQTTLLDSGEAIANRVISLLGENVMALDNKKQPVSYFATAAFKQTKLPITVITN
ncbi:glutamate racemase [Pseudoalteromonas sp.]|uniref:glutamate racemase n=1 Tax=Pseudoalteromonas sp. TaxID=53249 RepID=UPI003565B15F